MNHLIFIQYKIYKIYKINVMIYNYNTVVKYVI